MHYDIFCIFMGTGNTHTHLFNGFFSGTTQVSWYQKSKNQSGFYWNKREERVSGSGIGCTICKSAPCSPSDNHTSTPPLSFYRPDALSAAQPTASVPALNEVFD